MSAAPAPGRWLTYAAAGELLGISAESVQRRAQRQKWARQMSNAGVALTCVPEELLAAREGVTAPPPSPVTSPPPPAAGGFLDAMAVELAKLAEDARQARAEAASSAAKLAEAEAELARMRAMMLEEVAFHPRQAPPPGYRVVRSPAAGLYHWHRLVDGALGPARPDRWSARRGAQLAHRQSESSSS